MTASTYGLKVNWLPQARECYPVGGAVLGGWLFWVVVPPWKKWLTGSWADLEVYCLYASP